MGEFTIEITPSLIDRLLDDGQKSKSRTRRTKPKAPQRQLPKRDQKQISDDSEKEKGATGTAWPVQHPLFLPVPSPAYSTSPELDAIQSVVRESEMVVEKLRKQEESMVQEVTQKAKDLHEKEFKIPEQKPMPCLAETDALKSCYKENSNDLMKCSHLARHFADCAHRVRQLVCSADK